MVHFLDSPLPKFTFDKAIRLRFSFSIYDHGVRKTFSVQVFFIFYFFPKVCGWHSVPFSSPICNCPAHNFHCRRCGRWYAPGSVSAPCLSKNWQNCFSIVGKSSPPCPHNAYNLYVSDSIPAFSCQSSYCILSGIFPLNL